MQLAPRRLSELHSDLKIQEKDELQWKKIKAEGLDEDGEREAKLRRNFNSKTTQIWRFVPLGGGDSTKPRMAQEDIWNETSLW